ncbi:hypothetical protein GNF18_08045 [Ligilactobacillus pobuzihii]|uniref:hypothetical protein n=1 Tax=Ligilactobacillus pobuzihii TaxID=449659 RepID=UPI0019D2C277|nr:hypothetical protein [Ligilactobacillus pobuzihii]MBN7275086.1 hypothetical protein [Ligilactobacillus pobuzihii]
MTKYYRVRTPEQWDWLVNRFGQSETQWPEQGMSFEEIRECLASGGFVIVHNDYFPGVGSVLYTATPQNNGNVIEVSDLMEDEKMENKNIANSTEFSMPTSNKKIKDDGCVTISYFDLEKIKTSSGDAAFERVEMEDESTKYGLKHVVDELRIPKSLVQQKVKMTKAEKKEFDELKRHRGTVYGALDMIEDDYHKLYTRLFGNSSHEGDSKAQLEFARAWADPSLIEVIPEKKWNVKIPPFERTDRYYYKDGRKLGWASSDDNDEEDQQFTEYELKKYGLDDDMYEKVEVQE